MPNTAEHEAPAAEEEAASPQTNGRAKTSEPVITGVTPTPTGKKKDWKRSALFGVLAVALVGGSIFGTRYISYSRTHVSTDDATINGDLYTVSSKISGRINRVFVSNNQLVHKGQLLASIDDRDLRAQLEAARANLVTEEANARAAGVTVGITRKNTSSATSQAQAALEAARAQEAAAEQQVRAGQTQIPAAQAAVSVARAGVEQSRRQAQAGTASIPAAQSAIAAARANLTAAKNSIRSTAAGVVAAREAVAEAEQGIKAARQNVAGGQAAVSAAQSAVEVAAADVVAAKARADQADADAERARVLFEGGATPRVQLESAREAATTARAQVAAAEQREAAARANVLQTQATVASSQAGIAQAITRRNQTIAALRQAQVTASNSNDAVRVAQTKIDQAEADLAQARGNVSALQSGVTQEQAKVAQAATGVPEAASNVATLQAGVAEQRAKIAQAQAALAATNTAPEQVNVSSAQAQSALGKVLQARAQIDQLLLQLSYTKIVAPNDGVVSRKSIMVGQTVTNGQSLMSLSDLGSSYITANFKETQLDEMQAGDPVDIEIDAYPSREFHGHVLSFSAGTGAAFSLLPPENASGNFTKVVQRVPVKIAIDTKPDQFHPYRFGMSVVATVGIGGHKKNAKH